MNENHKKVSNGRVYKGLFVIFLVVCILVSLFSYQYYKSLHATIREESRNYLQEVSRRVGQNIDRVIADNFSILHAMGESLSATEPYGRDAVFSLLRKQQSHWNYEKILLVDRQGNAYDIDGARTTFMAFDDAMRTQMLNKEEAMATTQIVDNKEYLIFAVPLYDVVLEGEEYIALAGCYAPSAMDKVLSMTSFNDQAYSQIITKSGSVVTRSNSPFAIKSGYNIFSTIENASLDKGISLAKMKEDIQNDRENQISFSLDGVHRYMVYTPIQPDEWYLVTFVPFQAVNEKSDMLLRSTLVICGLITLVFCGLVAALLYVFTANKRKLEQIAYVDGITGGNTIQRFYELAGNTLATSPGTQFALVYTNIESFKVLNAQLGRQSCDSILRHFNIYATVMLRNNECIGRLTADNFCMLLQFENEVSMLERLTEWGIGAERYIHEQKLTWSMPETEFGIYVIENTSLPFPEMIDRAKLALKEAPHAVSGNNKLRYAFYDDKTRRQLFREKQLADMMETALVNREFQLYLQPKVHLPEEKIGGAEALVRWKSVSEGMIYPNEFIPLFEKNGFIVQLDLWIFEEVCRTMRGWIDRGLTPMKVSVNCSRIHFRNPHFLAPYIRLATEYRLDRGLLEIELTESVVFENTERLTKIIQEIRAAGFGCSMDDFGSGYSSLNLIQSIPVDTLKIDKIFFQRDSEGPDRTEAVVDSIIHMAHSLTMTVVAEGVEQREQVEMLKRVHCDYIQGYVFAKPMEVSAFEDMAFGAAQS